jgi:hypothetical protein
MECAFFDKEMECTYLDTGSINVLSNQVGKNSQHLVLFKDDASLSGGA